MEPQPYNKDRFVNRKEEVMAVKAALDSAVQQSRVLAFTGPRGSGKTWLIDHLENEFRGQDRIWCVKLNFESLRAETRNEPDFVRKVLQAFANALAAITGKIEAPERISPTRWGEWLIQDVRRITSEKTLLVLLDSVYETPETCLNALEDVFLGALVAENRVVVIMAGQGTYPLWRSRELARASVIPLRPFQADDLQELLEKRNIQLTVDWLTDWTGGYALPVGLLVENPADPVAMIEGTLTHILDNLPKNSGLPNPLRFLKDYMVLAVLRVFDEDRLEALGIKRPEVSQLIDQLLQWDLAAYQRDMRGYVLDEALHYLWGRWARERQKERWENLHQSASELYQKWARDYQATAQFWLTENAYHTKQVASLAQSVNSKLTQEVNHG